MPRPAVKLAAVLVALAVGLIAFAEPEAPYMPEGKRFPYVTFPLLPPLLAIALAIATRQVLPSLFVGVWVGALMVVAYDPLAATARSLSWLVENATDSWNATILLFDFVIGAFVGVLYASGSLHSAASAVARRVRSARGAGLATWLLGLAVFFDGYANTVVVGNTMRPVADRLRVSRELLSYIVDSTAAPVAGVMLVSTWIGYEVGLIKEAFEALAERAAAGAIPAAPEVRPYAAWLCSVPYRFYSILALLLVLLVVLTRRHFGPMLRAELRSVREGKVLRDGAQPLMPTETVLGAPAAARRAPAWVFAASVAALVGVTVLGMWVTGGGDRWWETPFVEALMNADSATALLWGSFAAYLVALAGALATRSLGFAAAMEYTVKGMYLMVYANAILLLAWSIRTATDAVGTADYVVHLATAAGVYPPLVPLVVFAASMFVSFTTGTSWGTFGIMMPIAVPMAWQVTLAATGDVSLAYTVTYASIAAVFAGGIFGDHCSPISDTTIMSSMFTSADHIDHVNTQIPYAVWAAAVGLLLYGLFAAGVTDPRVLLPAGVAVLAAGHQVISRVYAARAGLPPRVPNYVVEEA